MVPIEFAELGTELAVETPDERTSAIVVRKPFIDPQKEIPKQDLATAAAKDD
jgi:glycine cleavage system aminomethyltransferase T